MRLIHYRSVPEGAVLPVDQRWRTVELDPVEFDGLDLSTPQGVAAAIRRINDGKLANVEPFPHSTEVYLTNTDAADSWQLALTIQKN